jgi:hypothetical protein
VKARLDTAANIATIVLAIAALVLFGYKVSHRGHPAGPRVGSQLPIRRSANVERYAVLMLSTNCRFCSRDADFYRQLSARRDQRHRLIAVFPETSDEARRYLQRRGIVVDEVVASDLNRFNTSATPTVIITDGDGKVTKAWVGALAGDSRTDVLSSLACANCGP